MGAEFDTPLAVEYIQSKLNVADAPSRCFGNNTMVSLISEKLKRPPLLPLFLSALYAFDYLRELGPPSPSICGADMFTGRG